MECEFSEGEKWSDLLLTIGLIPDTVIILNEEKPIPEDEFVTPGEFDIIETASRG